MDEKALYLTIVLFFSTMIRRKGIRHDFSGGRNRVNLYTLWDTWGPYAMGNGMLSLANGRGSIL